MKDHEIDFVLVSSSVRKSPSSSDGFTAPEKRVAFEENLQNDGLVLEKERNGCLTFIKIYAPKDVLQRYCEILKFQMPLKKTQEEAAVISSVTESGWIYHRMRSTMSRVYNYFIQGDVGLDGTKLELRATYSREKSYLFDEADPTFFPPAIRTLIVHFILNRETWNNKEEANTESTGLKKLLSDNVYIAAYPLHDGDYKDRGTNRNYLFENWAELKRWYCRQPLDKIQEYLGTKHAFYFAWLGFYTRLLIPASIFGFLVLLYGAATLSSDDFSKDTCNADNITMCPTCDKTCDYFRLSENCFYVKATYLFDNTFTFIFAFLMAIWASTFLEIWKRYCGIITHRWGMIGYSVEEELPRPEYVSKIIGYNQCKINPITGKKEHVVPFWSVKLPAVIISYTTILFFIMLVIIAVVAVLIYRLWMRAIISATTSPSWIEEYSSFIVSGTAATLNLLTIMILNVIYSRVAEYLTSLELHRTQTEHESALTLKIYIFQFINYYSSIMYIAFFKGKFSGYPGHYNRIFGYRQEECSYGGCLMELSIQLAFIMIGKQLIGAIFEMTMPAFKKCLKASEMKNTENIEIPRLKEFSDLSAAPSSPWVDDFKLLDYESEGLFSEYLEMIIQFGFVTLFVPAFPLAPLFALLNNIFEIRLDAQKILKYYRRPIPYRVPDIGIWFQILQITGNLAVLTNAIVIAFSSSFIPRFVYVLNYGTDEGFLDHSLSIFNVSDYNVLERPKVTVADRNINFCMYEDFREPPSSPDKYQPNNLYWQIFIARLIFIILFQNITYAVKGFIDYIIPDEPENLKQLIKKEQYLTTKMIIKWEMESANKQNGEKENSELTVDKPSDTAATTQLATSLGTGIDRLKSNITAINQT